MKRREDVNCGVGKGEKNYTLDIINQHSLF